jgi:hypothetical protein
MSRFEKPLSFKFWFENLIYLVAFLHLINLLRYESRSALRLPFEKISLEPSEAPCATETSSDWLQVTHYLKCYPQSFKGRQTHMRGEGQAQ